MAAERWLSVREAAERLGESEKTVRRLISARKLAFRRGGATGRHILIAVASLDAYERATTTPAAPALTTAGRAPARRVSTASSKGFQHGRDCMPVLCSVCRAASAADAGLRHGAR